MGREVSIIAKNQISTHYRIYSLLNRKGYELEEAASQPWETDSDYIKMTLSLNISEHLVIQARKYLYKIIDVIEVEIL